MTHFPNFPAVAKKQLTTDVRLEHVWTLLGALVVTPDTLWRSVLVLHCIIVSCFQHSRCRINQTLLKSHISS